MQDLAAAWNELTNWLGSNDIQLFPVALDVPRPALRAVWPDEDWRSFLELALVLEVRVIYGAMHSFDARAAIARERDQAAGEIEPGIEEAIRDAAMYHDGDPVALQLAFSHEGVIHLYEAEADWFSEHQERILLEVDLLDARYEDEHAAHVRTQEDLEANAETWTRLLASSRDFYAAPNDDERRRAAAGLIPDLAPHLAKESPRQHRSQALQIVRSAHREARDNVIPELIASVRADPGDLVGEIAMDSQLSGATTKEGRRRVARALLWDRYGLSDPGLIDYLEQLAGAL
jgi:hypothetical protein